MPARVVGEYGWYHYDGQRLLSWGHPLATEAQLLALFDEPTNLSKQQREVWKANADAILTWDFVAGQMRLYDHWFDSTMKRQPIMNDLRGKARLGKVSKTSWKPILILQPCTNTLDESNAEQSRSQSGLLRTS